ncbi:MAG: hypothetical protein IKH81_06930 [Clostridia bacterium]|nr:hypothetical protein [Clostridia bacterium]
MDLYSMVKLVSATRQAHTAAETFSSLTNNHGNRLDDIYGNLLDCIYAICHEETGTLEESTTYKVIHSDDLTDQQAAEILMALT